MLNFDWSGLDEALAALEGAEDRVDAAMGAAVEAGVALVEGEARARLSRYSHQPRTPTPSPAGDPPALITGRLRSSFRVAGPTPEGAGRWTAVLGPTMPYARVQELGGPTGRGGASVLPPRPYLRPSVDAVVRSGRLEELMTRTVARALMP